MKLALIESPRNPNRLWLVDDADHSKKVSSHLSADDFTRPLQSQKGLDGSPADSLIVIAIKYMGRAAGGFSTWQDAAALLDTIPDATATAASVGQNLENLLNKS